MTQLYEITQRYLQALQAVDDETFSAEQMQDTLDGIAGELDDKIHNVALYILNLEAEAATIEYHEKRLKTRRERTKSQAESLRTYLREQTRKHKQAQVSSTSLYSLRLQNDRFLLPCRKLKERL